MTTLSNSMEAPMRLMTTITHRRRIRHVGYERASLDGYERGELAQDVGLSLNQLDDLTARRGGEELSLLLKAVGLVPERIRRTHPDVMRDMSVVCSGCVVARRCRGDLDRGWALAAQRHCPNTDMIRALQAARYYTVS